MKRRKTILELAIFALILLAGLLVFNGCDNSEPAAVRERIADILFYSNDRISQTIQLEGAAGNIDAEGTLDVAGTVAFAGALEVGGTLTVTNLVSTSVSFQTSYITATVSIVAEDVTITDTLDVNGDIDLDGDGFDVNITAGASIDTDGATNLSASTGDITIEAETGTLILKADEAVSDAIMLDANDAAGTGISITVGSSGGLWIGGGLTDIGGGAGGTANGDNDLLVAGDAEVDGVLRVDGSIDANGTAVDIDVSAGVSIDADTASNFSTSAQDITIDAEAGSVVIIGSEAAADSVSIDANDTVTSGLTIVVGSVSGMSVDGGLLDIGGGSYTTADGDNDLGVAGDLEVVGALSLVGIAGDVYYGIEVEAGDALTVTIQISDTNGTALATRAALPWYLSEDANGDAIANGAPSGGIAILADGLLLEWTADLSGLVVCEADGDINVVLTDNGTDQFYFVLVMPDGSLNVSTILNFP